MQKVRGAFYHIFLGSAVSSGINLKEVKEE
jgi:hypothetical protein